MPRNSSTQDRGSMESACNFLWDVSLLLFPGIHMIFAGGIWIRLVYIMTSVMPNSRSDINDEVSKTDNVSVWMSFIVSSLEVIVAIGLLLVEVCYKEGTHRILSRFDRNPASIQGNENAVSRRAKRIYCTLILMMATCLLFGTGIIIAQGFDLIHVAVIVLLWISYHLFGMHLIQSYKNRSHLINGNRDVDKGPEQNVPDGSSQDGALENGV